MARMRSGTELEFEHATTAHPTSKSLAVWCGRLGALVSRDVPPTDLRVKHARKCIAWLRTRAVLAKEIQSGAVDQETAKNILALILADDSPRKCSCGGSGFNESLCDHFHRITKEADQ